MNRRNFFKVVTGFVAGIFASSVKSEDFSDKRIQPRRICVPKSGPPGPTEIPAIWSVWYQDDAKMIQEAIDLAAKNGGVVYFPKDTYNIKYGIIV